MASPNCTPHSSVHPGFYLISPSEFERFSLSARNITEPLCSLDINWPRDATQARWVEGQPLAWGTCDQGQVSSHPRDCLPWAREWEGKDLGCQPRVIHLWSPSWPHLCSYRLRESPKLSQANGTPSILLAPQSLDGSPDPAHSKGPDTPEPPEAALSPMSIDSATSADTTLDTTGDVTVEDVKDFLG